MGSKSFGSIGLQDQRFTSTISSWGLVLGRSQPFGQWGCSDQLRLEVPPPMPAVALSEVAKLVGHMSPLRKPHASFILSCPSHLVDRSSEQRCFLIMALAKSRIDPVVLENGDKIFNHPVRMRCSVTCLWYTLLKFKTTWIATLRQRYISFGAELICCLTDIAGPGNSPKDLPSSSGLC